MDTLSRSAGVLVLVAATMSVAPAHAQVALATGGDSSSVRIAAARAQVAPRIDGLDDDAVWQTSERRSEFRTFMPVEDGDPAFRTEFRVAYDDRALYVFARAYDPRPDSIVRLLARRDSDGAPNDQFQLWVDPFHDRRSGYEYIVNAAGVKSDYVIFDDTGFDQSWDGAWTVATRVDSAGWTAEYAIPLRQLRFRRAAPSFGIMLWRLVGRTGERASWPAYQPSRSGYMSQAGTVDGLRDIDRSASLEVTPYTLARGRSRLSGESFGTSVSVGADARYVPTPDVSVDATFNPDFGQVESDPAVLDLSGFEVFLAERRPFFLEGAGQLHLPLANDGSALLFHSRRIGRPPALGSIGGSDAPTETTILGAARVSGRLSNTTPFVALGAVTTDESVASSQPGARQIVEPRTRYMVARVQRDFRSGRSSAGLMATGVERSMSDSLLEAIVPASAHAAALTTQHQTADGSHRLSGWISASRVTGSTDAMLLLQTSSVHGFQTPDDANDVDSTRTLLSGAAGQLFAGKVGGGVTRYHASYGWVSPGFNVNDLGFMPRSGVQKLSLEAGLRSNRPGRIAGMAYRSASATLGFDGNWSSAGLPLERGLALAATMQFPNMTQVNGTFSQQLAGAFCTFSCTRGDAALVDPPRTSAAILFVGDPRRRLLPQLRLDAYRDDEGRSHGTSARIDAVWRARSNLRIALAAGIDETTHDAIFHTRRDDRVVLARLERATTSVTARVDHTLTTTLSLQWYGEVYFSRGSYADPRTLADPRAVRYDDRFHSVSDSVSAIGPAGIDFRQFRSNAVLRWEYRPASTLYLVWTQGRNFESFSAARVGSRPDLGELFRLRPTNLLAIKASYWLGL